MAGLYHRGRLVSKTCISKAPKHPSLDGGHSTQTTAAEDRSLCPCECKDRLFFLKYTENHRMLNQLHTGGGGYVLSLSEEDI